MIELRWLKIHMSDRDISSHPTGLTDDWAHGGWMRVLQYRELHTTPSGDTAASAWRDIPIVENKLARIHFASPYVRHPITGEMVPNSGGQLYIRANGTLQGKAAYGDENGLLPLPRPIVLDSNGECVFYISGFYDVEVTDADNNLVLLNAGLVAE